MRLAEIKNMLEKNLRGAVDFWLRCSCDKEYGGILQSVDRDGECFSLDKDVAMQCKCAWAFAHLYNSIEKSEEYLGLSESCIRFVKEKCFDTDGRMLLTVTRDGRPLERSSNLLGEAFYASANIEYYKSTGKKEYLDEARRVYDMIFDIHTGGIGAGQAVVPGGERPYILLEEPTVLFGVNATMAKVDTERKERYNGNAELLFGELGRFYSEEYRATLEAIATDGRVITESERMRISNPGRAMECALLLLEEGRRLGSREMCNLGKRMFDCAYKIGWDEKYSGILHLVDVLGAPVPYYDQDVKLWWVHTEAIVAALSLYLHTGDYAYKMILEELLEYCFARFVDKDGEWCAALDRRGEPKDLMPRGFIGKGPYHTLRMYMRCIELLDGCEE